MTRTASGKPLTEKEYKAKRPTRKEWDTWTDEQKLEYYIFDPYYENWYIQKHFVKQLFTLVDWEGTMDGCCDAEGANKHFEKFCSAKQSCLK